MQTFNLTKKSSLRFLDEHRRGRLDLIEDYEVSPWSAVYSALHSFGYPNNKIASDKKSTFSYMFDTAYDGLYLELSDLKAYITVHLVYTDVAGEEMAQTHRDELHKIAEQIIEQLKKPVDHFGTLFDPLHDTFTE